MSEKIWSDEAWEDYLYWQLQDKKTLINNIPANIKAPRRPSEKALRGALRLLLDLGGRNSYSTMMLLPLISAGTGRPI